MLKMFFLRGLYLEENDYRIYTTDSRTFISARLDYGIFLFRVMETEEYRMCAKKALEWLDIYYDGWIDTGKVETGRKAICLFGDGFKDFDEAETFLYERVENAKRILQSA